MVERCPVGLETGECSLNLFFRNCRQTWRIRLGSMEKELGPAHVRHVADIVPQRGAEIDKAEGFIGFPPARPEHFFRQIRCGCWSLAARLVIGAESCVSPVRRQRGPCVFRCVRSPDRSCSERPGGLSGVVVRRQNLRSSRRTSDRGRSLGLGSFSSDNHHGSWFCPGPSESLTQLRWLRWLRCRFRQPASVRQAVVWPDQWYQLAGADDVSTTVTGHPSGSP